MKSKMLCMFSIFFVLTCTPLRAAGEISEPQAIELANKEIVKYYVSSAQWNVSAEKDRHDWRVTREAWEKWVATVARGRAADTHARIEQIEPAIKGKDVWFVTYNRIIPPGQVPRHSHAIVFLDAKTSEILDVIHPEE